MNVKETPALTLEDIVGISDVDTLPPGGFAITRRIAELSGMDKEKKVLVGVSHKGHQAIFYAQNYGARVIGVDNDPYMVEKAAEKAQKINLSEMVQFLHGDAQNLPFPNDSFDIVTNEWPVRIPADPQKVLDEMLRVLKKGQTAVFREPIWLKKLPLKEKENIIEHYGTAPFEHEEWLEMLKKAGAARVEIEFKKWSRPELFWKVRPDRDVEHYSQIFTATEKMFTAKRIMASFGKEGMMRAGENEKVFYEAVLDGKIGYCIIKGIKI